MSKGGGSDDLGYKQVSNVERRSWDLELYEKKAKERLERGDEAEEARPASSKAALNKEEFQPAPDGAQGPAGSRRAYLKARTEKVDLESRLHKTQVITSAAASSSQGGYWCEVCKCLLKDSIAYLDHINGKKHQRALGFSMRVERSSVGSVKEKLDKLRARAEDAAKASGAPRKSAVQEYEERLAEYAAAEERNRQERREAAAAAKEAAEHEEEQDEEAAAIAAMMGFGGFSGGKR
eukprot:TRINITY_DN15376_c0_g1_i3.p1 TRINITY_DN15376_c0_g1~~TRINITY_DN15376_c0_g1_i3.p1  ORF type:complete len:236 (+),score=92.73 TRINITY_DN15376_c0_g1_i3:218-925(+)